ncbi:MAG TPA: hypothetical protein VFZ53_12415, partial [Polyangiaceae bacterium]
GCAQPSEKGPPITCSGRRCGPIHIPPVTHVPPGDGEGGAGGSSSEDEAVRLLGDVVLLDDIPGLTASRFVESADVRVEGMSGDVTGRYLGADAFAIDGVARGQTTWAQVGPAPGDALLTLQPVDTSRPNDADEVETTLTVVRESELARAFSVIASPVTQNPGAAQLVLVVHKENRGASGVGVIARAAEAVIYVDNGSFSDIVETTDESGIVVLANVPADTWPGSGVTVTLVGTVNGIWDLRVVRGGVTFAGIGE